MKKIIFILIISILFISPIRALDLGSNAKSVILIETSTGNILYEKNSHEKLPPASMTKMMSMLLILENIDKGIIKWDDIVTVSANASGMGGSQILLETGEEMTVEDLFKGVAIGSGNDAVVALAEYIAGTVDEFVNMMNEKTKELNLTDTYFKNPHGLNDTNHYSSAYDMAMIAKELSKHEKVFEYTSIYEDYLREGTQRKLWLVNTNKLVRFYKGVDGLKTGYTEEAGYCLTATANKGFRVIAVVMGEPSSELRNKEVSEMLDYAYATYKLNTILKKDDTLGKEEVSLSKNKYATLVPIEDITILNKKIDEDKNYSYSITVDNLKAPIKRGDKVGYIDVLENGNIVKTVEITVKDDIKKANIIELYFRYIKELVTI
jgi:D-alanyl-D-alanine carboxypeptidase (penicillin-binding protein 5/6)